MSYQNIIVETKGRVGIIRLNRPQALNALNGVLIKELIAAIDAFDADADIGCMLITGSDKAFAAGADIKEMADKTFIDAISAISAPTEDATRVPASRSSPRSRALRSVAAASCHAVRSHHRRRQRQVRPARNQARRHPGIGGTQRLTRAVGKAKAMEMILTGRMMDAAEAERSGLVARVVPAASLMDEAMKVAETIATMSLPSVLAGKEAVNRAFEISLAEGVLLRAPHVPFAVCDRRSEGRHEGLRRKAQAGVEE